MVASFVTITVERFALGHMVKKHRELLAELRLEQAEHVRHTVEKHREHVKEIKQSVFYGVLEYAISADDDISNDVVEHFRTKVFGQTWYRTDLTLTFDFDSLPEGEILVTHTWDYKLHNKAREPRPIAIAHYFENVPPSGRDAITHFELRQNGKTICYHSLASTQSIEPYEKKAVCSSVGIRNCIESESIDVPAAGHVEVTFVYQTVNRISDCDSFFTTILANGIKVVVNLIDKNLQLFFEPDSAHPTQPEKKKSQSRTTYEWYIKEPLLPGHGFVLYWYPKDRLGQIVATEAVASM